MIFQHVIKGINGINKATADEILLQRGIMCNWWREQETITTSEIISKLNKRNLDWHVNRYNVTDPLTREPFSKNTPFISTTAGTVERDLLRATNVIHSALQVALEFATDGYRSDGYLFYCYVMVLGQKTVEHMAFAEEIRELNIYTRYSAYQLQGEITAKIYIPSTQIQRYEFYRISDINENLASGERPTSYLENENHNYLAPEDYSNVREILA